MSIPARALRRTAARRAVVAVVAVAGMAGLLPAAAPAAAGAVTEPTEPVAATQPVVPAEPVVVRGIYTAVHVHTGGAHPDHEEHYLAVDDGRRLRLWFDGPATLAPGAEAEVTGTPTADGSGINVAEAIALRAPAAGATAPSRLRVLVALTRWDGLPADAVTQTSATTTVGDVVGGWYDEVSDGRLSLAAVATPWLTVAPPSGCDFWTIADRAAAAAAGRGYDVGSYDRFLVYLPSYGGCDWAGLGEVGGTISWVNGALGLRVGAHELGHNFGLSHANAWHCSDAAGQRSLGGSCVHREYGDEWDVMGAGVGHFNAAHKARLGWLPGARAATVAAPGDHQLAPLAARTTAKQALRIPTVVRTYWVEYRAFTGFDAQLRGRPGMTEGVVVHTAPGGELGTRLLDLQPGTADGFADAALPAGATWSDPEGTLSLAVGAVTAVGADVRVTRVVPPRPVVTAVQPAAGPLAGGTKVTILGRHLTGATGVRFGATAASGVTVVHDGRITAAAPPRPAGAVAVTVRTPGGASAYSTDARYTYRPRPVVGGLSRRSATSAGGTAVTLTGSGLRGATEVRFGYVAARSFRVIDERTIAAVTPRHVARSLHVRVTSPGGTSATAPRTGFTFR